MVTEAKEYVASIVKEKELPLIPTDLQLQEGEDCHYYETGARLFGEQKELVGSGGGASVRVAKGLYLNSNRSRSHWESKMAVADRGTLYITNKRLIFIGALQQKTIKYEDILATRQYVDGIILNIAGQDNILQFGVHNSLFFKAALHMASHGKDIEKSSSELSYSVSRN